MPRDIEFGPLSATHDEMEDTFFPPLLVRALKSTPSFQLCIVGECGTHAQFLPSSLGLLNSHKNRLQSQDGAADNGGRKMGVLTVAATALRGGLLKLSCSISSLQQQTHAKVAIVDRSNPE